MSKTKWHRLSDAGTVTIARRIPVRLDVAASAEMPLARKGRLAHQVRQDLWRELQDLRGFSPVVRVEPRGAGLCVTAGGRLEGRAPVSQVKARIAALLEDPQKRARWLRHARLSEEGASA